MAAAASGPFPQTSPIVRIQSPRAAFEDVVEVAADHAGRRGHVARGELGVVDLGEVRRQQTLLQGLREGRGVAVALGQGTLRVDPAA